jgi:2-polyprenyl-3-methyl-5-hydroxy-6-metoxy-1,4-benzoquinol methylase/spore coat polysaccharide biosynthesis protein SpsF (cytidylyltransferase family)
MQWMVQASSRSWSGARDICMNPVKGQSAVFHTLSRIIEHFPQSQIVIAAPGFDSDGQLPAIAAAFPTQVQLYFGHTESPLKRMIAAHREFISDDSFIRIDALNMFFQPRHVAQMWEQGVSLALDCAKFPDDYPIQFTADFYRIGALERLVQELEQDSPYQIHPKYALLHNPDAACEYYWPADPIADSVLEAAREDAMELYLEPRDPIVEKRIAHGDTLSFHYAMALPYIEEEFCVLDIACGGAYGPLTLAQKARQVVGADLDAACIREAQAAADENSRVYFSCEDVTATRFADASFDLITSFETIEHVDERLYLKEIHRLLKPGGMLLLSTPQNALGHIPMNPQHVVEYSLEQICDKVAPLFDCEEIVGIKQGCIVFKADPTGTNTFMKLRSKNL